MASDFGFVEYVCDQLGAAGVITHRKMFGEYAIYCEGKVVALVTDNRLFVKPTDATLALYGSGPRGMPFPGAKAWYHIQERLDDHVWLCQLIQATEQALPPPSLKKPRVRAR
jgi:DNA transformation protein and related proteins